MILRVVSFILQFATLEIIRWKRNEGNKTAYRQKKVTAKGRPFLYSQISLKLKNQMHPGITELLCQALKILPDLWLTSS